MQLIAQTPNLVITTRQGSQIESEINSINSLYFSQNILTITEQQSVASFSLYSIEKITFSQVVGIKETSTQSALTLFPNPVQATFTLENIPSGISEIQIYSLKGDLVHQFTSSFSNTYSVNDLGSGIYIIKAGNEIVKFIKQ